MRHIMVRTKYEHTNRTDVNEAGLIWDDIAGSRVDRFHKKIVVHEKSVLFGYADVTLAISTASGCTFPFKVRGLVVKSLKGKPHVDMPSQLGADGEYYDQFMPRSGAGRTVLTTFIFADEEVQEAIAEAANAPIETAETSTETPSDAPTLQAGNPFAAGA